MNNKLSIIIEEDENGFFAYCPELKGCHSQGDTNDEALENIKEAIDLYLETISSDDLKPIFSKNIFSTSYEVEFA
jgi:predicted RNase H-like HicB family nuclease